MIKGKIDRTLIKNKRTAVRVEQMCLKSYPCYNCYTGTCMCLSHGLRETKRTELNDYSRKYPAVPSKLVLECALNAIYFKKNKKNLIP